MRTIRELLDVGREHEVAIVSEAGGSLTVRRIVLARDRIGVLRGRSIWPIPK